MNLEFRGSAELWRWNFHANFAWFGACRISPEAITVRAATSEHIHPQMDLLELRWVRLPWPYFIVISRTGEEIRYSSFQILRWSKLRAALDSSGYAFTEELRYYSWRRVREDVRRYDLGSRAHTRAT